MSGDQPVSDLGLPADWTLADMFRDAPDGDSPTAVWDRLGDRP